MKQPAALGSLSLVYFLLILAVGSWAEGPQPWVPGWHKVLLPSDATPQRSAKPAGQVPAGAGRADGQPRGPAAMLNSNALGRTLKQQEAPNGVNPAKPSTGPDSSSNTGSSAVDHPRAADPQAPAAAAPAAPNNTKWFWPVDPAPPPDPPAPSPCPGRISVVWCHEDANGTLQDITYLNTDTGYTQLTCSNQSSPNDFSKALFLLEHESIVSVRACSSDTNGYASVTFITDMGQMLTCGQAPDGAGTPPAPTPPDDPGQSPSPPEDNPPDEQPPEDEDPGEAPPEDQEPGEEPPEDQDPGEAPPEDEDPDWPGWPEEPPTDGNPDDGWRSNHTVTHPGGKPSNNTVTHPGGKHKQARKDHQHNDDKSKEKREKRRKKKQDKVDRRNGKTGPVGNENTPGATQSPQQGGVPSVHEAEKIAVSNDNLRATSGEGNGRTWEGVRHPQGVSSSNQPNSASEQKPRGIKEQQHDEEHRAGQYRRSLLARTSVDRAAQEGTTGARKRDGPLSETSAAKPATFWWWWWWGDSGEEPPISGKECQEFNSGRLPQWAQERQQRGRKQKPGAPKAFSMGGSGNGQYVAFEDTHYFKDYKTYLQHLNTYKTSPASLGFVPKFFFHEVYPLASFGLQCDGKGFASQFTDFCWNDQYTQPSAPEGVPDVFTLILDAAMARELAWPCPSTPAELQKLQQDLNTLSHQLSAASNGLVQEVYFAPYIPSLCVPGSAEQNTTITIDVQWVPAPGSSDTDIVTWLLLQAPKDLCDLTVDSKSACDNTQFITVLHLLGDLLGNDKKQRRQSDSFKKLEQELHKRLEARKQKPSAA